MHAKYLALSFFLIHSLNGFAGINVVYHSADSDRIIDTYLGSVQEYTQTFQQEDKSSSAQDIVLKDGRSTFLYCSKATRQIGDLVLQGGEHMKWKGNAEVGWAIKVPSNEKYDLFLIADVLGESKNQEMFFSVGSKIFKFKINPTSGPWIGGGKNFQRIKILSKIPLPEGSQEVMIKSTNIANENVLLNFRSIELVPVSTSLSIEKEKKLAVGSRASTEWLGKVGYGLMFHWTSQSVNQDGSNKSYEQAVIDFDVEKFANMVETTGAGYVIFTIGHAKAYCPAPIASWEKYHPGMTTKRDLIAEIADQLKKKNVRLICYLPTHVVAKYKKVDGVEFMKINTEILREMGNRYRDKIEGYWFDGWYQCFEEYPDVSFKDFFEATKAGNKDRIIALNSWIYPAVTPWQEYWAGEVASPVALPEKGFMKNGPVPDLRYQALLIMEPYWVQEKAIMPDPRYSSAQLSEYIANCMNNGGAVTINMGIYQDGQVGDKALQVMKEVRNQIRTKKLTVK
ncbi:MAG: hypothetical protein D4R64_13480 [Porphyromonadaceae bacterium]|nr:MAG: hypothetical protein D4R64_13480 [Porphyromonadaceae bacterium]